MHVNDSPAPAAAGRQPGEPRPAADEAQTAPRSGRGFRGALERKRRHRGRRAGPRTPPRRRRWRAGFAPSHPRSDGRRRRPGGRRRGAAGASIGSSSARVPRRAGADSHRRRCARRHGDPAFQRRRRARGRGAALDTRGEFAADAVRGDGRDQVAAAGQGNRAVHGGAAGRPTRGDEAERRPGRGDRRAVPDGQTGSGR